MTIRCCLRSSTRLLLVSMAPVLLAAGAARADDWPAFRGPNGDGVSAETGWKTTWSQAGPKIAWKKNVGVGASSIVVVGEKVITMGNRDNRDVVSCLNAEDGKVIWEFDYASTFSKRNFEGGTTSTPTVDGEFVYTLSYNGQLHCIRLADGKRVWRKNVVREFGGRPPRWKYAGSPTVEADLLILDIGGRGNSTIALDKTSGKKVWGSGSDGAGYATPVGFHQGKTRGVLVFKATALVAVRVADGRELWRVPWRTAYDVNASSPTALADSFFVSSGYGGGRGALYSLAGGRPRRVWLNGDIKTKMNSCVIREGYVYGISEKGGKLMCMSLKNGKTAWSQSGFGYGTLMIAGDKIVALSERGELVIAEASAKGFQVAARAKVLGGRCWVSPVLANGRIYCKNNKGSLVCVDVRGEAATKAGK